ncbi:type VII secretion target [Rhodococcoides kyotonense]|uniref:type VII secretion target n=1 Tax=Rhodococcoides kyotonense TaxID=398843 RepID=UPI001595C62A|nr:type VII secretion target [Rhodococcus kyotonensis]
MDSSVVWEAAARTRVVAQDADDALASQESVLRDCHAGWSVRSRREFENFLDHSTARRTGLNAALTRLDDGLRHAAYSYEQTDASAAAVVESSKPGDGPLLSW